MRNALIVAIIIIAAVIILPGVLEQEATSDPTIPTPTTPSIVIEAGNIKSGVTVNGVTGTFTSDGTATASDLASGKTAYVNGEKITGTYEPLSTSDANATAADIASGKTAYVDGVKITGTYTAPAPATLPTLNAPTITLTGSTLTVTNPSTNGSFVSGYDLYNGTTKVNENLITSTTINISSYLTPADSITFGVKAKGINFNDSVMSNTVTYNAGFIVNVSSAGGMGALRIYDGTSNTATLIGTCTDGGSASVRIASGNIFVELNGGNEDPGAAWSSTGGVTTTTSTTRTYLATVTANGNISYYSDFS